MSDCSPTKGLAFRMIMAKVQEIVFIFTVLFSILDYVLCVNLIGNCSVNSPPEQMVVKEIKGAPVMITCRLYNTDACINGTMPPYLTGSDVGPPRELLVGGKVIPGRFTGFSSQVHIRWEAPSSSIPGLKGFLFEITEYNISHGNNDSRLFCRIFDMSETAFTVGNTLTFEKKMVGLRGSKNYYYRLDVFSLPKSPSSVPRTKFFTVQSQRSKGQISAERWSTFISYDTLNLTAPASLSIHFTLEKTRYNFTRYDVMLVSDRDPNNAAETCSVLTHTAYTCFNQTFPPPDVNQKRVTVSFPGLKEGDYFIQIRPVDSALCSPCLISQTPYFVVNAPPEVTVTVFNPLLQSPERERYIAVGVGCGLGLFILATMLVIFRWKRGRKRSSPVTEIRNNNPFNNDKGKSIFLLCGKDNDFHKETVEKFALYLSNFHRYTVHYLPWKTDVMNYEEKCTWMRLAMDTADFIIVVNSKSAFDAFKRGSSDSISFGISYLRSKTCDEAFFRKTIYVTFDYTEDKFCIKDLNPNAQYQIPNQLNSFLVFLSGNKCIENDMESTAGLHNSPEGIALREAIRKCKARNRSVTNCDMQDDFDQHKHISQEPCPLAPSEVHSVSTGVIERGIIQITEHYEACKLLNQFVNPEPSEVTSASTNDIEMRFIDINTKYEDLNTVTECSDSNESFQSSFAQMPGQDNGTRSHNGSDEVHRTSLRDDEYSDKASNWSTPTNLTNLSQTTTEVMDELYNVNKLCSLQEVEIPKKRDEDSCSNGTTKTFRSNSHFERLSNAKRLSADGAGDHENQASIINDNDYFKFQPPSDIESDVLTDDINEMYDNIIVNSCANTRM